MIIFLSVKNLAIIENLEIDFKDKMTVLTGETGTGKTLIIDAISYLFGEKTSKDIIRTGEEKAEIEGIFTNNSKLLEDKLKSLGVEIDDQIIVRREVSNNYKNICRINGVSISLNKLTEIAEYFGDIHQQNDTLKLINPKNYLEFIDSNIDNQIFNEYQNMFALLKDKKIELQTLIDRQKQFSEQEDFLRYQLMELENSKLNVKEEEELLEKIKRVNNSEKINIIVNDFKSIYNNDEILDKLYLSIEYLKSLEKFLPKIKNDIVDLEDCYYRIEDIISRIKNTNIDIVDNNEINFINERLYIYSNLQKKYKRKTVELVELKEELLAKVNSLENFDFDLKEKEKEILIIESKVKKIADLISEKRKAVALEIEETTNSHLKELHLNNTLFKISFEKTSITKTGCDIVDFLVSFNKGEELKQLSKVASGGELSRFMLALKTSINSKLNSQLFIFDEIDQGVSGVVAQSIALKLKTISKDNQVLCISHLPQVAAIADNHLKINKEIKDNRTITTIKYLSFDERVYEIASMISKNKVTESSIALAKELLNE